jgi:hypothetical protein
VGKFFYYAIGLSKAERVRQCLKVAYASEGAITYEAAIRLTLWELSAVDSAIEELQKQAKANK